ncbi:winged helix-turn-helix domain-containing protein [Halorussus salinisoli]|uniref:winged helix-turn-helix domain-containing protein n=1 Tax=Halorussus salinisoli TaxID=2558242 RepID=UPI0010C16692|nr:helix-turn-helix domain-containing protein [Halorussus salinisoli]
MSDSDSPNPADVFGVVADETRMTILRALAEAPYEEYEGTLTFSELRERAGIRDSGQFNYHLDTLVGQFVERTDDGYGLTYPGELLYRTIVAGLFTRRTELESRDVDSECLDCGAPLEMAYDEAVLRIVCSDCDREYMSVEFPPSAVESRGDDCLETFDQWVRHHVLLMNRDVCVWCAGPMPGELRYRDDDEAPYVARNCEHCGGFMWTTPGETVLYHPAVVSFFYERGVDVTSRPLWELEFVVSDDAVEVRSEDPWELVVTITCEGDEMRVVLDGDAEVVEIEDGAV